MRIEVDIVGVSGDLPELQWSIEWPLPRVGEAVTIPGLPPLTVRAVDWFPLGEDDDYDPFVFVALGPAL